MLFKIYIKLLEEVIQSFASKVPSYVDNILLFPLLCLTFDPKEAISLFLNVA